MDSVEDLVEEAKVRTVWWAICVLLLAFFLSRNLLLHLSPEFPLSFFFFFFFNSVNYDIKLIDRRVL